MKAQYGHNQQYNQTVYSDRDWRSGQSWLSECTRLGTLYTPTPPLGASNGISKAQRVAESKQSVRVQRLAQNTKS